MTDRQQQLLPRAHHHHTAVTPPPTPEMPPPPRKRLRVLDQENRCLENSDELTAAAAAGLALVGEFPPVVLHPGQNNTTTATTTSPLTTGQAQAQAQLHRNQPNSTLVACGTQPKTTNNNTSNTNSNTNPSQIGGTNKSGKTTTRKKPAAHRKLPPHLTNAYQRLDSITDSELEQAVQEKIAADQMLQDAKRRAAAAHQNLTSLQQEKQSLEHQLLEGELQLDNEFSRNYQKLVAFQQQHGHCNCSQGELGKWVKKMRRMRHKYMKEQQQQTKKGDNKTTNTTSNSNSNSSNYCSPVKYYIQALDRLHFVWDAVKDQWQTQFDKMLAFKMDNGHCCIPKAYPPDKPLGAWVHRQRYFYKLYHEGKPNQLTPERIELLNSVGFSWSGDSTTPPEVSARPRPTKTRKGNNKRSAEEEWEFHFQMLLDFKKQYGHVRVNALDDKSRNNQLRDWCAWQRREYKRWKNGQPSHVSSEQVRRLKEVGFQWDQYLLGRPSSDHSSGSGSGKSDATDGATDKASSTSPPAPKDKPAVPVNHKQKQKTDKTEVTTGVNKHDAARSPQAPLGQTKNPRLKIK